MAINTCLKSAKGVKEKWLEGINGREVKGKGATLKGLICKKKQKAQTK
ncbi:MAG: hypothetical protein RBR45_14690 [Pseudomonas sp.]|jgi:hypothetical protein|nr:hypothetical protein [Pseudomonas sp.]